MKILFLSTKGPLPPNDGHSIRTYNLLKNIADRHEVYLLSFVKYRDEHNQIMTLKKICKEVILIDLPENESRFSLLISVIKSIFLRKPFIAIKYDKFEMHQAISKAIDKYNIDIIHLDMLPLGCYMHHFAGKWVLLNEHNIEYNLLKRRVDIERNVIAKWFYKFQMNQLKRFECDILRSVDHIVVCSSVDKDMAESLEIKTPVTVVPNGVDTHYFSPNPDRKEDGKRLLFVGGFNWFPNRDGITWFDQEIFPGILEKIPDIRLSIVGRAEGDVTLKHKGNMEIVGYVDDIRPSLEKASVFIVPLRIGGGTRLKILDAMSMGKPVVSTRIGAEGLNVRDGEGIFLSDEPDEFAARVVELLKNHEKRRNAGVAARSFVCANYRWEEISGRLLDAYESSLSKGA